MTNEEIYQEILCEIDIAMDSVISLIELTDKLNGFGSLYPAECQRELMLMRIIFKAELKETTKAILGKGLNDQSN